jgi:hypothetical protein
MGELERAIADFKVKRSQTKNDLMNSKMSMIFRKSKIFELIKKEKVYYVSSFLPRTTPRCMTTKCSSCRTAANRPSTSKSPPTRFPRSASRSNSI